MTRILVVDDDLVYLDSLTEGLMALGYSVVTATSGREALAVLAAQPVDLVISDVIMGGGGAVSLLHDIRKGHPKLPVIVITGRPEVATSPLFNQGMRQANARLRKTATLSELDDLMKQLLAE